VTDTHSEKKERVPAGRKRGIGRLGGKSEGDGLLLIERG